MTTKAGNKCIHIANGWSHCEWQITRSSHRAIQAMNTFISWVNSPNNCMMSGAQYSARTGRYQVVLIQHTNMIPNNVFPSAAWLWRLTCVLWIYMQSGIYMICWHFSLIIECDYGRTYPDIFVEIGASRQNLKREGWTDLCIWSYQAPKLIVVPSKLCHTNEVLLSHSGILIAVTSQLYIIQLYRAIIVCAITYVCV